jgi:hypothetical protein
MVWMMFCDKLQSRFTRAGQGGGRWRVSMYSSHRQTQRSARKSSVREAPNGEVVLDGKTSRPPGNLGDRRRPRLHGGARYHAARLRARRHRCGGLARVGKPPFPVAAPSKRLLSPVLSNKRRSHTKSKSTADLAKIHKLAKINPGTVQTPQLRRSTYRKIIYVHQNSTCQTFPTPDFGPVTRVY